MSVLIKGMEMPTSCHSCCFFGQAYIWESDFEGYTKSYCNRTGSHTFDYVDKILPNCPLIPVPPHGRLIDADALYKDLLEDVGYGEAERFNDYWLGEQPTVIPAEPAEEASP